MGQLGQARPGQARLALEQACADLATHRKPTQLLIWDLREAADVTSSAVPEAHSMDINCLSFSPYDPFLLATGSSDTTVKLWDMRNLKSCLHELAGHTKEVYQVQWAPFNGQSRLPYSHARTLARDPSTAQSPPHHQHTRRRDNPGKLWR